MVKENEYPSPTKIIWSGGKVGLKMETRCKKLTVQSELLFFVLTLSAYYFRIQ